MAAARVRVALPWLQMALAEASANDALPAMDALRWLGGRGRLVSGGPRAWREWLLEPVGGADLLAHWPAGPALALENGLTAAGPGSWCVAQPVHFAAGLDHLRLAPLAQAALTEDDASALGTLVGSHFGTGELTVAAFVHGAWLLRCARSIDCSTQPADAVVGHNVHDFMPAGRDGARIRSLMNEIQMLLHEHPVNQRRERARQLPVNGWWLWGFGHAVPEGSTASVNRWSVCSDDSWLRALGHALGGVAGDISAVGSEMQRGDTFIALSQPPAQRVEESLTSVDAGLLSMLASNVRAGAMQSLDLLVGDATLHIDASARFRFWRRPVDVSRWLA
ncbi:MAG: hypothetical protein NTU56_10920 [Proteobacteria bacterium]|nr:hypothetical protein [Pseudomonadota bacterium]